MAHNSVTAEQPDHQEFGRHKAPGFWVQTLGSIGVVYGDIGTSPLYAFREAATIASGGSAGVNEAVVLGVLSLIIWALILIVAVKYVAILLNADNRGEGGTLSLMALAQRAFGGSSGPIAVITVLGMLGASLFYGDAMITPAISVLSAVEGLNLITPHLKHYVIPISVGILIILFLVQSHGTATVAKLFGPITLIWFVVIAAAGLPHIWEEPDILRAFNPVYGVRFLIAHGVTGFLAIGAVFLAVTGAEALYADLGHFGKKPIRFAWSMLVLPCLLLNYLGQGAMVLQHPQTISNPFFLLVPESFLPVLVVLATMATIIASQAVISGAYSLTRQGIQLGLLPRMEVRFTSETHAGQIYLPQINWIILFGVLVLVLLFRNSSSLASAYGIAVTGTMVVTAIMAIIVIWKDWKWSLIAACAVMGPLLLLDVVFLSANVLKVKDGGWVPLALGAFVFIVMWTWRRGSKIVFAKTRKIEVPICDLAGSLSRRKPHLVNGTAIFLTADRESAPTALMHSLKHFRVLHEANALLTVRYSDLPFVTGDDKITLEPINDLFTRITITFGFMEIPNVPKLLTKAKKLGWKFDIMTTSFFLSRRSVRASPNSGMPLWQDHLFIWLARNADNASHYFRIPTDRVVEIGTQISV